MQIFGRRLMILAAGLITISSFNGRAELLAERTNVSPRGIRFCASREMRFTASPLRKKESPRGRPVDDGDDEEASEEDVPTAPASET